MSSLSVPDSTFRGSWKVLKRRNLQSKKVLNTRSLLLFSPSSRVRTACHSLVTWRHFDNIMLFFILASSLILAIEDPLDDNREKNNQILLYADIGVVAIFTFEIVVKLVDQGAFAHKGSYLRDWWNVFDTFVVACNIAATALALNGNGKITDMIGESTVKAMRIMRVFRPLRVVNKITGLKLVFQCVVFSLKRVLNIIIITMLCLFMFAVIGNHLFQGKFHYCTDVSKLTEHECQGEFYYYHNPIVQPDNYTIMTRVWKNYDFNFDNVPIAMLTLFTCGTGEGWPIIMEKSIDATDVDRGPIPDNNMYLCLYYVFFVVVYSFFFLNIFVALIIVTFQEQGEKEMIGSELNKNQRACLHFVLTAKPRQRFMPADKQGFAFKIWRVVDSKPFEIVIMSMIASNAVVLMLSYDSQSAEYERVLEKVNLTFTFLFTIEALLKLIAYQLNYFRDGWNVFDFCIVFVTVVGAFINMFPANPQDLPIDPSFFRLFRAFRLLKLLRQGYNIRILLWTFLQSLKALPYVVLLIVMLFFIYAVIGMQLFSKIRFDNRRQINEYNNFRGFLRSLGVLFRCGTGEAWHLVMLDCFDNAVCYNDPGSYCGSTVASITYFCSFYFFYAFLLLNLFVAVIMDNFDYLTRDESILGPHHMDEFVRVWSDYDPSAAGRIAHEDIYQLMCDMQPPVGFGKKCPRFLAYKRLMKLNMPISGDNTVLFTPTIFALVRTSLRMTQHDHECFKDSSFRKIIKRIWPNTVQKTLDIMMPEQTVLSDQQITIGKIYAAKLIYESFKDIKKRKTCTLPQFEMFEATHKRGNSFFHKVMGALRTSSQPLVPPERPREQPGDVPYYRRRRSQTNSASSKNEFGERLSQPSPRVRSVSTAGFTHRPADFLTLANKINLSSQQSYPMLSSNTPTRGRSNKLYDEITFQCPRRQSPRRSRVTSPVESFTPDKIESFDQTNNDSENTRANCDMPTRNKCLKSSSFTHCDLTSRESNNSDNSVFTADNKHLTDVFVQSVVNVLVDSKCERLKAAAKKINDANLTSERTCSNVGSCSGTNSNLNGKNSGYIVDDSNICRTNKNNSSDNTNAEASSLCRTNSNLNNKNNKAGSPTSPEKHSPVSSSCRRPSTKQISTRHYTSPLLASSPENVASFEANSMAAEIEEGRRESRALTDSLITALRDPAKPILCFVNQQMPSSSGVEPHSGDTGMESRSNTSSTSHVTVTLPMIKLEIPVERSESSRGSNFTMQQNRHRPLCSTDFPVTCSNVPDLIQSTRKKPQQQQQQQNADQTNSQISEDQSESSSTKTSNSPSSEGPEVRPPAEEEGMSGEEILRDRVSRALARQTQWIYKLENKDTWC